MRFVLSVIMALGLSLPVSAWAQDKETLADIRQQLTVLHVEIQKLKRELSTSGAAGGQIGGTDMLTRIDSIEGQVRRLTGKTEELEFSIKRIVADGTNRIGDLEFRLVELEGGDLSTLGETTTLGGDSESPTAPVAPMQNGGAQTELAVGEEADFRRASEALDGGDYANAAVLFASFSETYPGGPMAGEAHLRRGQALEGAGQMTQAARAYLESFSTAPTGLVAHESLYHLGASLGHLGQTNEACVTLAEVEKRFPTSASVVRAKSQMSAFNCP